MGIDYEYEASIEKLKGAIVFISLQSLRFKPLLSHHNILSSGVQIKPQHV